MSLFNIQRGADYLGIGTSTLRRWIMRGEIPIVRLGRRVLLRQESLERFVKAVEKKTQTHSKGRKPENQKKGS